MTRVSKDAKRAGSAVEARPQDAEDRTDAGWEDAPEVEIEDAIDLHGFRPRDIPLVIEDYLEAAAEKGFREVRLIHGKGIGFQRNRVRQILEKHPLVLRFGNAPATRGGWGATLVWLKGSG